MNKTDLIQKIKQLEGISQDERSYLINLVNTKKKYGLVWEDKPEDVEEQLRTQLPVLREVVERRILAKDLPQEPKSAEPKETTLFSDTENQNSVSQLPIKGEAPNHILIEGDNLHALTALTFTHEGKIDVMYFDPPYNTGNKSWRYNNDFVEKEDSFKHSKWLSFMSKRLKISKSLLKTDGVIVVTIDDYEIAPLILLLDEIFGEENRLGIITVENKPSGRTTDKFFATSHEYYLFYCKNPQDVVVNTLNLSEIQTAEYKLIDEVSPYKWRDFLRTGGFSTPSERPNSYYAIFYNPIKNTISFDNSNDGFEILPIDSKGMKRVWRRTRPTLLDDFAKGDILFVKSKNGKWNVRIKDRIKLGIKPKTVWINPKYDASSHGTKLIESILNEPRLFDFPKSIWAVKDTIDLLLRHKKDSLVLDIFAGSGTTLHATMQLNVEDGGNRQCILVTNNENNICEEVTYKRNRRVIQGYTNSKKEWVPGLINNNLRYYKSEFVGREPSLKNKRELTRLATELLCIKEDCYTEKTLDFTFLNKSDSKNIRFFEEIDKRMLVVYDDSAIESSVEIIKSIIANNQIPEDEIKVYVFSPGQYPFTEEFEEVLYYITLCALPDAIYKAFLNVLPKRQRESIPELEEDVVDNQPELFD